MAKRITHFFAMVALIAANGCDKPAAPSPPAPATAPSTSASAKTRTTKSPTPVAPASGSSTAFVRKPQAFGDAVDACTQVGGNYFSCNGQYGEEKDPVVKRYLWRIAQGYAASESSYTHGGTAIEKGEVPHAEVPYMCEPSKPCGAKTESGELNGALNCLARAHEARLMKDATAARAAHAKACKCDADHGQFPAYNHTAFICDDQGKPAFIAPDMSKSEGDDIVACASCDAEKGPAACQREVQRLKNTDEALSKYIETTQVPRCRRPAPPPE